MGPLRLGATGLLKLDYDGRYREDTFPQNVYRCIMNVRLLVLGKAVHNPLSI